MIFDYSYKPSKDDIVVSLFMNNCDTIYDGFEADLTEYTKKYDVTYLPLSDQSNPKYQASLFRHMLILDKTDDIETAVEKYRTMFASYNCLSIGFIYSSLQAMESANLIVNKLKMIYGDRINFLRPDTEEKGTWFCSKLKILDNSICDTIRIKYHPKKISDHSPILPHQIKQFFNDASRLYTQYHLYHRSASDGFFAVRYGDGIVVTATKTYKNPLYCERLSYIHGYDEQTNTLSYSGKYLPSSDSVEAWVVFKNNPDITAIIHTHASELFTRNPLYSDRIKVAKGTYGDPMIGHQINAHIQDYLNNFIILEQHGEYFAFTLDADCIADKFEDMLTQASCVNMV